MSALLAYDSKKVSWDKSSLVEAQHDDFVCKLQTYLTSCLQLFVSGQLPSLIFADSLGLFICQLVSPFARFPVVNSSCLLCQRQTTKKLLHYYKDMAVCALVVTPFVVTKVICIQAVHPQFFKLQNTLMDLQPGAFRERVKIELS